MKKKNFLTSYNFEFNIQCAENGLFIEYPVANGVFARQTKCVATSKQEVLDLISKQLDEIYD